jgi:hypothetical protein
LCYTREIGMTKIRFGVRFVLVALFCGTAFGGLQDSFSDPTPQPAVPPAHAQFFAGTVVELDANHIRVTRTLVGRPTESRSFAINATTKMNRAAIKLHNRVTVRYKRLPEGDVALEIQPPPAITRAPKS